MTRRKLPKKKKKSDGRMRVKALCRSGVCARGMGLLNPARDFFKKILDEDEDEEEEEGYLDERTKRDARVQLRKTIEEKKRYKKFAKEMCAPSKEENVEIIILPGKEVRTEKELKKMAEAEEEREKYLNDRRRMRELEERAKNGGDVTGPTKLTDVMIMMTEEDCIEALDTLAERYAKTEVQEALQDATLDHNLHFSKGFIFRSKKILAPLQQDIFEKHGFLAPPMEMEGKVPEIIGVDPKDVEKKEENEKLVNAIALFSSNFEKSLGDLSLVGTGVREKNGTKIYSLAVYAGEEAKVKIAGMSSDEKEGIPLHTSLKMLNPTIFHLKLDTAVSVPDMSRVVMELISNHVANNTVLAMCSSLMFLAAGALDVTEFSTGTIFEFERTDAETKFSVGGKEVDKSNRLTVGAFLVPLWKVASRAPPNLNRRN